MVIGWIIARAIGCKPVRPLDRRSKDMEGFLMYWNSGSFSDALRSGHAMHESCGDTEAYRKTPGTMGVVRRADRLLASQLYQRGLSVKVIENALVLAARAG